MGRHSRKSGFTLLELLVTIAIAGILIALAVPGFTSFIGSNRAEVQKSSFVNAINYARSEAVKRGVTIRITPLVASKWQGGWRIWSDVNNDAVLSATDTELQINPAFTGVATLTSAATGLAFDRFGSSIGIEVGSSVTFAYRVDADNCSLGGDIAINHLGRTIMTQGACP